MEPEDVAAFAVAAEKLRMLPALALRPELDAFRELVASFGARPPVPATTEGPLQIDLVDLSDGEGAAEVRVADSDEETDLGRIPGEPEPPPPLAPSCEAEASAEKVEACARAKEAAQEALARGETEASLQCLTEAILTGAAGALVYTRRGELLLAQRRPQAAVRDCSAALQANPDCGKAYRVRGTAHRALGQWALAHRDLALAQRLDYDEEAAELQRFVAERLRRLEAGRGPAPPAVGPGPQGKRRRPA
mmetsp:Transcript_52260/g.144722  ORF Transcript_52260/g.144722 Transcript_52260/m.144722 type:complete len:249 (-) Transcript_52260:425-1171(-)|eukprot:CAMPEP_0179074970 /NCGR_PEP_ID=MMETSP0796-20121207/33355_1 /TAXON_ID=73915 /ORGANISM="Pyrodinium bahamense, Strain pbaha01" /LENGTH=248 /DNA_ID=CAMNT_0020772199 /DNA_START=80 /DNA_END=826 /DNA_ORIENTATION=-